MKKQKKYVHLLVNQEELWSEEKKHVKNKKNKREKKMKIGEKIFTAIGWLAISPFLLSELVVRGFKWVIKKIRRK